MVVTVVVVETVVVVDVVEVTKATMEETTILRIFVIFLDLMINLPFHSTSKYTNVFASSFVEIYISIYIVNIILTLTFICACDIFG